MPLRKDVPSPLAPRNDEEPVREVSGNAKQQEKKEGATTSSSASPAPVAIDLEGFERRLVVLPPKPGNYDELAAIPGKVLYHRTSRTGADDQKNPIVAYDLKEREEEDDRRRRDDVPRFGRRQEAAGAAPEPVRDRRVRGRTKSWTRRWRPRTSR